MLDCINAPFCFTFELVSVSKPPLAVIAPVTVTAVSVPTDVIAGCAAVVTVAAVPLALPVTLPVRLPTTHPLAVTAPVNVPPVLADTVSLGLKADNAITSTTSEAANAARFVIVDPFVATQSVPTTNFTPFR